MSTNTSAEFHGQGIALSGAGNLTVGRDIIIGGQTSSDQDKQFLSDLYSTDPRDDKRRIERTKGGLLRDSYQWILEHDDFCRWRDNDDSRLLWVKGDPGKGKTMLLCGIIDELDKVPADDGTMSYFFCQATDERLNSAMAVLRGLVYMLLVQKPSLIPSIRQKYDHAGKQLFEGVNAWDALSKMFLDLLENPSLKRVYLVIDALDECETNLTQLLRLIVQLLSSSSSGMRLIVSSRNWPIIEEALGDATQKTRLSLELNRQSVSIAVGRYIRFKADQLARLKRYDDKLRNAVQRHLSLNSNDTFLWVALVCQELARENVRKWHTLAKLHTFPPGLDSLYIRMLNHIEASMDANLCKQVLGLLLVAHRPLTMEEVLPLLCLPEDFPEELDNIEEIVSLCGSLLTIRDGVVYFVHPSAADFLKGSASNQIHPHGEAHEHRIIVAKSLQVMSRTLRRDIYNLKVPGTFIDEVQRPHDSPLSAAGYSCIHWVDHFAAGSLGNDSCPQEIVSVRDFLGEHFLHWLEALSVLRNKTGGIVLVNRLLGTLERFSDVPQDLLLFVADAKRFVLSFWSIIERVPLQAYVSSLMFAPGTSEVRRRFWNERWALVNIQGVKQEWDAHRQTLEGHEDTVAAIAFSPDGCLLASASGDQTIRLWDATSGSTQHKLEVQGGSAPFITFSPDSKLLAAGTDGGDIWLWDPVCGSLRFVLNCHGERITAIAFSSEAGLLTSSIHHESDNETVRVWNTNTGSLVQTIDISQVYSMRRVIFSPDGRTLASASSDRTFQIWDVTTGTRQHVINYKGHNWAVAIEYSPNGQLIAAGQSDGTTCIWDVKTGACRQTLNGTDARDGFLVRWVRFAPDGVLVATPSEGFAFEIWNSITGERHLNRSRLREHGHQVTTAVFSPNGQIIASASSDGTMRIWEVATGSQLQMFQCGFDSTDLIALAFSPDGHVLATTSPSITVELWNVTTDMNHSRTYEGHESKVRSVIFSPNGQIVASFADDETIQLWGGTTGRHLQTISDFALPYMYSRPTFSPDGQLLSLEGRSIDVWDVLKSINQKTPRAAYEKGRRCTIEAGFSQAMAFSPSGHQIVTASFQHMYVWDIAASEIPDNIIGPYERTPVGSLAVSPNGQMVVLGSHDGKIRLWDIGTEETYSTFEGHNGIVSEVVFSSDGRMIASGSNDQTVRLWNIDTGKVQHVCEGHENIITAVAFSPDGRIVVSSSLDMTIRTWDVATGELQQTLDVGCSRNLTFDQSSDLQLLTDIGNLRMVANAPPGASTPLRSLLLPIEFGLSPERDWILINSKKAVWIPPEYQPDRTRPEEYTSAVRDSAIFIGCLSGCILRIFAPHTGFSEVSDEESHPAEKDSTEEDTEY